MNSPLICPKCRKRFSKVHIEAESIQCPSCHAEMFSINETETEAVTRSVDWFPSFLGKGIRRAKAAAMVLYIREVVKSKQVEER